MRQTLWQMLDAPTLRFADTLMGWNCYSTVLPILFRPLSFQQLPMWSELATEFPRLSWNAKPSRGSPCRTTTAVTGRPPSDCPF